MRQVFSLRQRRLKCISEAVIEVLEGRQLLSANSPLSNIPALDSRPSATAKIYLDFTGAQAFAWSAYNVPVTPAFDLDGDPTTFSSGELSVIRQIWGAVAEAYSPFNIDVTTVDPNPSNPGNYAVNQAMRIVIGGSNSWIGNYGGFSSTNAFFTPFFGNQIRNSFVFPSALGNDTRNIADAISHEAGHEFGLDHQSVYSGTTLVSVYNPGNALVGPIMGVPFGSQRALWYNGPTDAGYNVIQDDLAVISNTNPSTFADNGFGYAALTAGQSVATATPLTLSSGAATASGVIESTAQTDFYSFTTTGGAVTLNVNVAQFGAMLHAQQLIEDSNGNIVASADNASTLGQSITVNLPAGNYYLVVESFGQYGDIGQYTVSGTVPRSAPAGSFSIAGASTANEQGSYSLSLSANDPGQTVSSWAINWGDGNTQNVAGNPSAVAHTYAAGPRNYSISATATDATGTYSASNSLNVSVAHVPPTLSLSGAASVNEGSLYTVNLSSLELAGHAIASWAINWGDGNTQTVSGNPSSATHIYAAGPHSETISATATDDVGTYAAGNALTLNVAHVPPALSLSGASSVTERSVYTLNLSGTDPGHTISGWTINWGDGATQSVAGNSQAITHTYALGPRDDTISAAATDDVSTYSAANTVTVSVTHAPPVLSLSGAAAVNEGQVYTLGLSAADPNHTVSNWFINWGDGNAQTVAGNAPSVTHIYAVGPRADTISATATDDVGTYSAANTVAVSVAHVPPTLTLSGPASVNEGSPYTLNLSASDPNHTLSSWVINWGDGSIQNVAGNPSAATHVFSPGPGAETISATATDDVGTYTVGNTIALNVLHVPPTLTLSGATTVSAGSLYTLGLSTSELSGHAVASWLINWGDGANQLVNGNPSSVTHTFPMQPNRYSVTATATDDVGAYPAGNALNVSVAEAPLSLILSGASSVNEGSVYTLILSGTDPGHIISNWTINWGDGNTQAVTGNPPNATHTFASGPSTETINATATDDVATYPASNSVVVNVAHIPPTLVLSGPASVNEGAAYTLGLSASDLNHTVSGWTINWGDGSIQNIAGNPSNATHTYASGPQVDTISATATDDVNTYPAGNAVAVTIVHVPPILTIAGASSVFEGAVYTLSLSANDPGHLVSSWLINWGDGITQNVSGSASNATHTYLVGPQSDTISATATDDVGTYSAGNTVAINVAHVPPTLTLSGPASVNVGSPYTLNLSASDPNHTLSSWIINWGDGNAQTVAGNPSSVAHTFVSVPNTYSVSATATDDVSTYSAANTVAVSVVPRTFATLTGGVLTVISTSNPANIEVSESGGMYTVTENGVASTPFLASSVSQMFLSGSAGNDTITVDANIVLGAH
ncbi:MAG: hypothetical protein M3O30_09840, partial [Planctomycetota bacterium]|nr:hypothetical protein [Planctomycetota bacterium]